MSIPDAANLKLPTAATIKFYFRICSKIYRASWARAEFAFRSGDYDESS